MNKLLISNQLQEAYTPILEIATTITESNFNFKPSRNRWTAGQQLQHLIISTRIFNNSIRIPKSILQEKFGTNDNAVRSYEKIAVEYQAKLKEGGTAPNRFAPELLDYSHKESITNQLKAELDQLLTALKEWSEEDLNKYVLPHPLLGMLSIRELFGFTIYHTKHHTEILQEEYLVHN